MDNILDIFNDDAFGVTSLALALKDLTPVSTRLGDMALFDTIPVNTLSVAIERMGDTLQLVPPSERGSAGNTRGVEERTLEDIRIPHFQRDWSIYADEVQGIRAFGKTTVLETVMGKVADKIAVNSRDLDATEELSRLGAVQGIVRYKGGKTLNLFTRFGVTPPVEIGFDLKDTSPADGYLRRKCAAVIRATSAALGGHTFDHVHALVGDDFFDDLLQHPEVRETYKGWDEAKILRDSYIGKSNSKGRVFEFGGIVWENYGKPASSTGDAALIGIDADKAKFFPVGAPGVFASFYGPADYIETVNTMGLRRYAKQWRMENDKGINGETQTNMLHICAKPNVLQSGRRGA